VAIEGRPADAADDVPSETFQSQMEAARRLTERFNVTFRDANISMVVRGKYRKTSGWVFRAAEDPDLPSEGWRDDMVCYGLDLKKTVLVGALRSTAILSTPSKGRASFSSTTGGAPPSRPRGRPLLRPLARGILSTSRGIGTADAKRHGVIRTKFSISRMIEEYTGEKSKEEIYFMCDRIEHGCMDVFDRTSRIV